MKRIILLGAGGHCISCIDVIDSTKQFEIVGILDPNEPVGKLVCGYPVLGDDSLIKKYCEQDCSFVITVGQIKSSNSRKTLYNLIKSFEGELPVIISPYSYVSSSAYIAEGTIVMHHAIVNSMANLGQCSIINTKALVEHESIIGEFCHISTGVCVNGQVSIGNECFIGSNTVVGNNLLIANNVVIGAGSQVLRNIITKGVYVGNPLRKIR